MAKNWQVAALVVAAAGMLLSSCSSDSDSSETPETVGVAAPIMKSPSDLAGQEVTILVSRQLVVTVAADPEEWNEGSVDNTDVAEFIAGRVDGSASYNPGFKGLKAGETTARISQPGDGEDIVFTLIVQE